MQLKNFATASPRRGRLLKENKSPANSKPAEQPRPSTPEKPRPRCASTAPPSPGTGTAVVRQVTSIEADEKSPNTFFVNNFWESDGPRILFDRLNASSELHSAYRSFLKERAAAEKDYAKQLRKTTESGNLLKAIDRETGTFASSLTYQLNAMESLASAHEALGNTIATTLEPKLKEHAQSSEERRKKQQAAAESSWKAKLAAQTTLTAATDKAKKEANSIASYSAQLTIVAPRELSKIQANLDKCRKNIGKTMDEYRNATKAYKHACSNFEYDFKMFCDLAQDLEEDKIQTICDVGAQLATLEQRTYQAMIKAQQKSPFDEVDVEDCISTFVQDRRTGHRIYSAPEPMDLESNQEADTQVTFRVASFPRSSFRYPSSRMSKRASSANLSDAEPLTQTSPKASPTRPRTASRLHPTPKSPSALRHESSSASSASEVSSKQSVTTPSDTSETSDAVSSASEALENMRLHRKTPDTTSKRDRNGKGSMIAIGGKLYPVTSPSPSPQTPERVVKPKQGNSSERTKTRNDFHTPPYANQATGNHEEYSPSPLRKRSMVVPNSANSDIPSSMPSEKMADDTYTEIEAWLAQNRASSPVPAQKPIPSSASEPTLQPSGLPVAKSRHAQKRVPLPSNPSISRASSSHPQAHRHSSSEDVFLSSPSQAPQRPKSPRLEHHARSSSSSLQHTRSQSDMALSSRGSSSSSQSSISYHRSPSPTPFDDVPRPVSPNPLTGSTNTVTGKTFARPRQPTPPQQPYMPPQPQQRPGFRPYPIASSPAPAAPSWPSSQAPYFMHQTSSMSELSSYAPYQLSQSPAPFSLPPSAPTPAPALSYHPAPQAQPPASPPRRVVCYVRAAHPYAAAQGDELSMQPGEEIAILKTDPSGWWYGQSRMSGQSGLVPSNHVQTL